MKKGKVTSLVWHNSEEIKNTYRKFGEKIGFEGKAREMLIKNALSIGWVRVRYYMCGNRWSIQCRDSEEQNNIIKIFIAYLFDVENEKGLPFNN